MGKKAVKRSWSKHNVPMEIWSEILVRLPVRSLVRFRCVSRSWKAVIDDPDFCRDHLVRFKNNRDETHLLAVQDYTKETQYCFLRCSDTMKTSRNLGFLGSWRKKASMYKSTAMPDFNGAWRILFSVDGLVLLKYGCYTPNAKLMLWNPSIRKCRILQLSTNSVELGLGFDPLIKDYKIVRVSPRTSSVEIYTVGTASWRTVTRAQGILLPSTWLQTFCERSSVYFKGSLYIPSGSKLISFDLSREVFISVNPPEYDTSASPPFRHRCALVDECSSLAVLHFSSNRATVWVMESNTAAVASWSKRCTFALRVPFFLYLKKNGDMILKSYLLVSYNIHTEEEKPLTNYRKVTSHILGYKESLILLK